MIAQPIAKDKISRLADAVADELRRRQAGHCLRVDHLELGECVRACGELRNLVDDETDVFVLADFEDELHLPVDRAIELRNRKRKKVCIFVPASLQDVAASSLGNSFSAFPLREFLQQTAEDLLKSVGSERLEYVALIKSRLCGGARVPIEQEIEYLTALQVDPRLTAIGENLWRVGLIPDLREDYESFARYLDLNRICVERLVRPLKPQSGLLERIASLHLKPNSIQPRLAQFLQGLRLTSDGSWLQDILGAPELTFDNWLFPELIPSDLDYVTVEPFHEAGKLKTGNGLKQESIGTIPYAPCGPKCKVKVKWLSEPAKPRNVGEWLVEMVPNPDEYPGVDPDTIDLPKKRVRGSANSATLPVDFDLETLEVRSVIIRVTAIDSMGVEIRNFETDLPIYDVSQPFYLEEHDGNSASSTKRLPVDRCLADAYLAVSFRTREKELRHVPLDPVEKDLLYLPVQINERHIARIATSSFLLALEQEACASPTTPLAFDAMASDIEPLTRDHASATPIQLGDYVDEKVWKEFANARKRTLDHIKAQSCHSVCALRYSPEVCESVLRLAKAYVNLCNAVCSLSDRDAARFTIAADLLSRMDCLDVQFPGRSGGGSVVIHLPLHPSRLLWMAAYSEWVHWMADSILSSAPTLRKKLLDPAILRHISPDNIPAWTARPGRVPAYFVDSLHFAYAVSLPVGTLDPAALFAETAWAVGLGDPESRLASVEGPRVSEQVRRYRGLHPYASGLRVAAVNTGSGTFLTSALLDSMRPMEGAEAESADCQLDLIHCLRPGDAIPRAEAERFLAEWQRSSVAAVGDHLRPSAQVSLLRLNLDTGLPGDDVHLSVMLDGHAPTLRVKPRASVRRDPRLYGAGSLALFGLLTRLQSDFETNDSSAIWWHGLALDDCQSAGTHPTRPAYTKFIVDVHDSHQALLGSVLAVSATEDGAPSLCTEVDADGMKIVSFFHENSDWVLSVDRHFGIEFYDSPNDVHVGRNAERYLLDYVPEFIEGLGHRQIVTTKWTEEITQIMQGAMGQLGLSVDPKNCLRLLAVLKALSGRLALRLASEDSLAQETIGLAVAVAHMLAQGELTDAIVIPIDAHIGFFREAKRNEQVDTASRCDLIVLRGVKNRLKADFIVVKSRSGIGTPPVDLLDRMVEQTHRTEQLFRTVFFGEEPRFDLPIQRCRLASVLRFYLERARRHGRMSSDESYGALMDTIGRVETGEAKLISNHRAILVDLGGAPRKPFSHQDTQVFVLTGPQIESSTGIVLSQKDSLEVPAADTPNSDLPEGQQQTETPPCESPDLPEGSASTSRIQPDDQGDTSNDESAQGRSDVKIQLGVSVRSEAPVCYVGSTSGSPHLFVLGIPGQGKSWTMQRLVTSCASQGVPSLIIDFHGQFADPSGPVAQLARPLVMDASHGLPFSPFEASPTLGPTNWKTNAFQVAEIIEHVFDLGEMQRDVLYEAIRDAYTAGGFADGDGSLPTMSSVYQRLQQREEERKGVRNTTARCRPLFEFSLFNESPEHAVSFSEAYKRGAVIDLHSLGIEVLQNAAGAFVLRKLYKDMFGWGETKRLRLMVVLDEAHRLAKDVTLPKLMKEGRKFGIGVMVASQSVQDFHPEILENAGTKIAYRLNHPQNRHVSGFFRPSAHGEDLAALLATLSVGQALIQAPHMPTAVRADMLPLD